ncbi:MULTISPECIES: MrcB family domain-containing protein [Sulfitobacter]|nr:MULTISPECIES: DUF3578 domain-containing protein [Sulfitobacter]UWR36698.1 DUF3578 domain-containing protein [Sulfitobacter sp. W074]
MSRLYEMLASTAEGYAYERAKPFAGSEFGNFVRHDLALEAKKRLIFLPYDLTVKASVGAGKWAGVPWLGFFDPLITKSATNGFYVVYLINAQTRDIYLSLNQGTTAVYQEFGETRGRKVLERRALDIRERVSDFANNFDISPIDLGSDESLPSGYAAGHSFGRRYSPEVIDEDMFDSDFEQMLAAYEALIDRGGTTPTDVLRDDADSTSIEEVRKYSLSKRIERAAGVRKAVLQRRNAVCEGCGFDPEVHMKYSGPPEKTPLDVHHTSPVNWLAEGESRRYKIPDDFYVLCPTCHRMIHKQSDPSDLDYLRDSIQFVHKFKPK